VTQPAGTIFVLRSGDVTGAVIRLITPTPASTTLGCASAAAALSRQRCAVRSPDAHTGALYGGRLLAEMERQRPGIGADVAAAALALLGTPYGFVDIVALGLADLGLRQWWLERVVDRQHALVCSQLVDQACLNAGVHLFTDGRMPGRVDPGDLQRLILAGGQDVRVD